jgi:hypothetical protein
VSHCERIGMGCRQGVCVCACLECQRHFGFSCNDDSIPGDFVLPTDSEERKQIPIFSGVLNYFPLAIAAVARVSKRGNDQHNPGEPLHWARGKSMDHADCIARHLIDIETANPETGEFDDAMALAWRALAKLQELEEKRLVKGYSRGSK